MTRSEVATIYTEAATRARAEPSKSELAVWSSTLGHADIRDLKAAIDAHFEQSKWMPKESELRPLVEQSRQARIAKDRAPVQLSAWRCRECKAGVTSFELGFSPKRCRGIYRRPHRNGDHDAPCGSTNFELRLREPLTVASQLPRADVARVRPVRDRTAASEGDYGDAA